MTEQYEQMSFQTRALLLGGEPDVTTGAIAPPIVLSNMFVTSPDTGFTASSQWGKPGFIYSRLRNPTVQRLENRLAGLEGGETAVCFGSGMAAVSALFFGLLKAGDHLVLGNVGYAGVQGLARHILPDFGIVVTLVDVSDPEEVARAIRPETKLIYFETPANPILRLGDIRAIGDIVHSAGAELAVDTTLASPAATRPLEFGADYVIHSLTKYLGGHGDAMGGAIVGRTARIDLIRLRAGVHLGAVLSPFSAWLILRGLATLPFRMQQHSLNAQRLAEYLEQRQDVELVSYPGLASHPQHELAKQQMDCFSGMLAFRVADGPALARRIAERAQLMHYAVSLGDLRTLVFYIDTNELQTSSFGLSDPDLAKYRAIAGNGIFRVSVGLEDPDDLIRDLERAIG